MRKIAALIIAAVMLASTLAACASAPASGGSKSKFKVDVSLPPANNAWQARLLEFVNEQAAKYADEFEFTVKNAVDDADQLNQLNIFKNDKPDLIVCLPGNGTLLTPVMEDIYNAGIKTVILDRGIESEKYTALVMGDNYGGGVNAANYLGRLLNGTGDVAVLRSYTGIPIDMERYNGFSETIKANYPGIKIIVEGDGEFNRNAGLEAMTNILPGYPKIDAVYAQDDEAALGALNAIENAKRTDIKYITGFGGTKDAYDKIAANDPVYRASMSYFPSMGRNGIDMAVTILKGAPFQKKTVLPSVVVDNTNVKDFMGETY